MRQSIQERNAITGDGNCDNGITEDGISVEFSDD